MRTENVIEKKQFNKLTNSWANLLLGESFSLTEIF